MIRISRAGGDAIAENSILAGVLDKDMNVPSSKEAEFVMCEYSKATLDLILRRKSQTLVKHGRADVRNPNMIQRKKS